MLTELYVHTVWPTGDESDVTESQISVNDLPKIRFSRKSHLPTKCKPSNAFASSSVQVYCLYSTLLFLVIMADESVDLHCSQHCTYCLRPVWNALLLSL